MPPAARRDEAALRKRSRLPQIARSPLPLPLPAGFLAGAGAEIFGAGPILGQLSRAPQPALLVMALITAGSIVPIVKGAKGEYLQSLRDTYTLPEGVFTEAMEKFHGRLAMVGLGGLIAVELLKGSALL